MPFGKSQLIERITVETRVENSITTFSPKCVAGSTHKVETPPAMLHQEAAILWRPSF